jgi:hypothetical protein
LIGLWLLLLLLLLLLLPLLLTQSTEIGRRRTFGRRRLNI